MLPRAKPMRFVDWLVTVPITYLDSAGEAAEE